MNNKERIQEIIQNHFRSVGCAMCQNNITKEHCPYCIPIQHNNMWHISREYSEKIANEIFDELNC